ncbi:MAG: SRPBCC domain-containing protein [Candidatus Solibacter usitatus]|nr:SRPBCC domain-containing protein [Candidatus Solibacter usitatus]
MAAANLDAVFAAVAHPARRAILARLASGEATVQELAEPFTMTQPAISKHLKVWSPGWRRRGSPRADGDARSDQGYPDGWTMPVCEIDLRVGGAYRYVWRKESTGTEMGMGGVFHEVVSPEKLVATEKFDDPWYPGEALDTTAFEERGEITKIRLTVLYESKEARDTATRSGMEYGMAAGYSRLEQVLAALLETEPKPALH